MSSRRRRTATAPVACFEMEDCQRARIDASRLIMGNASRDPTALAARLAEQFLRQNEGVLRALDIAHDVTYDGRQVSIVLTSACRVGAIPLLSPNTGQADHGLVVHPRFSWAGIGPMMALTGWKVIPKMLRLPLLPRSARNIPPWLLSAVILLRIQALLTQLDRRFDMVEEHVEAPRGAVDWQAYVCGQMPRAQFLRVPCRFPDLRDDREVKSAIHFTLQKQLASLETQQGVGVVQPLLLLCRRLLGQVVAFPARQPSPVRFQSWLSRPLRRAAFREGLQAMEWTVEDRGLAGLSDFQGLPWAMNMEEYFEALIESLMERVARQTGGIVRVGRKRETITPLHWEPPYLGSQRYLAPDVVLLREDEIVIVDAKYKTHWEELRLHGWKGLEEEIRERHREDLLQVLAYASTFSSPKITACLLYPCQQATWQTMLLQKRTFHQASIRAGSRQLTILLTAVPLESALDEAVVHIVRALRAA